MSRLDLNPDRELSQSEAAAMEKLRLTSFPIEERQRLLHEFDETQRLSLIDDQKFLQNVALADELFLLDRLPEARAQYIRALREPHIEGPVLFNVYKNLGNIALRDADLAAAEDFYNKAFTMNPDSDTLMVNYGSLHVQRGELDLAVQRFRRAVELNRSNPKAWLGLAVVHREFGDADLAWANLEAALDLQPENDTAIRLVADWANKDGEFERGLRRLGRYLSLKPDDAFMHMMMAKFYYFHVRLDEAYAHAQTALNQDQSLDGIREVLGVIEDEIRVREQRFK
jgi:tetratricopeptide (TPR) repeat protein